MLPDNSYTTKYNCKVQSCHRTQLLCVGPEEILPRRRQRCCALLLHGWFFSSNWRIPCILNANSLAESFQVSGHCSQNSYLACSYRSASWALNTHWLLSPEFQSSTKLLKAVRSELSQEYCTILAAISVSFMVTNAVMKLQNQGNLGRQALLGLYFSITADYWRKSGQEVDLGGRSRYRGHQLLLTRFYFSMPRSVHLVIEPRINKVGWTLLSQTLIK